MTIYDFLFRLVEEHPGFSILCVLFIGIPYGILMWPMVSPAWREKRRLSVTAHESVVGLDDRLTHITRELEALRREGPMKVSVQLETVISMLSTIQQQIHERHN